MSNRTIKTCSIEGCDKPASSRGWCHTHYTRWYRHGDPNVRLCAASPEETFRKYTEWSGNCLIWTGYKNNNGYGVMSIDGVVKYAHRYAWERTSGNIPNGKSVDHICHTPACVNKKHLRLSSHTQNMWNLSGPATNNQSSGVRNVYRSGNRWRVQVKKNGILNWFGTYATVEEAAVVAEQARLELFGEFAGRG